MANLQESIQLLEEMGLNSNYRCRYCNEILIVRMFKRKAKFGLIESFRCTTCKFTFKLQNCKICKEKKYSHHIGVCENCFNSSDLRRLEGIMDEQTKKFKKIVLVNSRRKPDIAVQITKSTYNKIVQMALEQKVSRNDIVKKAIEKITNS